jgi:uncharacterized protein (DUF39 family)
MSRVKTYQEINEKIRSGDIVVVTAEEVIPLLEQYGPEELVEKVDVVTTATFGPMCSSGAFINFGHSDPPIKMSKVWLNDVPAYTGIAAVDAYIGATELSETEGMEYGGAHVIEDLISGKPVRLKAISQGTDCYPRRELETWITLDDLNQAYLFNPRNAYQNYSVATNTTDKIMHTYMGTLMPHMGNINYGTAGELSPLINDPYYRTIGIGTRILLGGAQGFVAWHGTQHNPNQVRNEKGVPVSGAGSLALIGDLKQMDRSYIRAAIFHRYGVSMFVGVGIPIPILNKDIALEVGIRNSEIQATICDYGCQQRNRPVVGRVSYQELRSGQVIINGQKICTAPISSIKKAREIAELLKQQITQGTFELTQPVQRLPATADIHSLEIQQREVR